MCHSEEDDELWNTDPHEYIRIKYGMYNLYLFLEAYFHLSTTEFFFDKEWVYICNFFAYFLTSKLP